MKKLKALIVFLLLVVVALGVFVFLLATGKVGFVQTECNCKETVVTKVEDIKLDVNKLEEINKGDFNIIKQYSSEYDSINLLTNGKVMFDFDRSISNVSNAIDMLLINENLYILTSDGDVYKYFTGITNNASLDATKVEELKDIKKIVKYATRGQESGGCDYIVAIDKDNNYKTVEDFCI
jgi:uncharacterized protein YfkK (UPF0435 family)